MHYLGLGLPYLSLFCSLRDTPSCARGCLFSVPHFAFLVLWTIAAYCHVTFYY